MQSDKGLFPSVLFFYLLTSVGLSGQDGGVHCGKREAHTLIDYIALRCSTFPCIAIHCYPLPCTIAIYNAIYIAIYFAISCSYTLPPHCPPFWVAIAQVATGFPPGTMEIISGNRHEDWAAQLIPLDRLWYLSPEREKWQGPIWSYLTFATKFTHVGPCSQATQKN